MSHGAPTSFFQLRSSTTRVLKIDVAELPKRWENCTKQAQCPETKRDHSQGILGKCLNSAWKISLCVKLVVE